MHNRTGEDRDAHEAIEAALKSLIDAGKADNTFLWDRQKLIRESKEVLTRIIADRVSKRAADRLEQQRRFFLFGDVFVEKVPAKRTAWRFTALQNEQATERQPEPVDLAQIIKSVKKRKWTLLIGDFGVGKSTMALQSASSVGSNLLYARADELPNVERSIGTNYLMQNVLRSLELFPELDDKSAEELERLSGTLLRKLLCNPETGMVLVVDGLDESPTYSSARGLVQLTNELEEIRSPIVLVTRKEHFDATYGNFARGAGLMRAREALVGEYYRGQGHRPVLTIGLQPLASNPGGMAPELVALSGWPGFAYLVYGFTREELFATARQIIAGAQSALPRELLQPIDDILRHSSEVRHWLENRLRNVVGALGNFEKAARGEIRLHSANLEPVAAVSREHRAMLERLWVLDAPARVAAPRVGGLGPLRTAITAFESRWQAVEAARAVLRAPAKEGSEDCMREMVRCLDGVRAALEEAIGETRALDRELMMSEVS